MSSRNDCDSPLILSCTCSEEKQCQPNASVLHVQGSGDGQTIINEESGGESSFTTMLSHNSNNEELIENSSSSSSSSSIGTTTSSSGYDDTDDENDKHEEAFNIMNEINNEIRRREKREPLPLWNEKLLSELVHLEIVENNREMGQEEESQYIPSQFLIELEKLVNTRELFQVSNVTKMKVVTQEFIATCDRVKHKFLKDLAKVRKKYLENKDNWKNELTEREKEQLEYIEYMDDRYGIIFDESDFNEIIGQFSCCKEHCMCYWKRARGFYKTSTKNTNNVDLKLSMSAISDITHVLQNLEKNIDDEFLLTLKKMQALENRVSCLYDIIYIVGDIDKKFSSEQLEDMAFEKEIDDEERKQKYAPLSVKLIYEMARKDIKQCFSMYKTHLMKYGGEENYCNIAKKYRNLQLASCDCENKLKLPSHLFIENIIATCGSLFWSYASTCNSTKERNTYHKLAHSCVKYAFQLFPNYRNTILYSIYLRDILNYHERIRVLDHSIALHERLHEQHFDENCWLSERFEIECAKNPFSCICSNDSHDDTDLTTLYNNKALQLKLMGKYSQSLETYNTLMTKYIIPRHQVYPQEFSNPQEIPETEFEACNILRSSELLSWRKEEAFILNNRAFTYISLERYDEAVADFHRAYQLDASQHSYSHNLGFSYSFKEDHSNSVLWYTKCIELFKKSGNDKSDILDTYRNRGMSLVDWKKYDLAIIDFSIYLDGIYEEYSTPEETPENVKENMATAFYSMAMCKKHRGYIVSGMNDLLIARELMSDLEILDLEEWEAEYSSMCLGFYLTL
ncbi:hypothetical protein FDP41_012231 [Naegleria fowleri]|uniref:Uncharacterized protein n=1 Tax=Naegleria fowleri TaxID=5763 RepID=A0A6A5C532_NAEFO|nr:uncharacterized protein FDP41_012231 [Naegleria fowleri]KAF0981574.1 hypothetical protein FDP41_012231 [Naegleria fowleri]CAG4716526.1 unnamed protein product [Naegleria fowleri]